MSDAHKILAISRPPLCESAQAGGEYTTATGAYVLVQLKPLGMAELTIEAAEQLEKELAAAVKEANRLRHTTHTVPLRLED